MARAWTKQTTLANHHRILIIKSQTDGLMPSDAVHYPVNMKHTASSLMKSCEFHVKLIMGHAMVATIVIFAFS